ncbi:hypothetical protein CCR95_22420 [Thiocystis minor]|uniref:hypothetical protein n=1 Tax=Thiocystis minor TaxID=61597 RepID=UPI001911D1C2|nr:hypothetical protein [Thiocystis minor]MBK5966754.1 hypothetical protein [Thiocystis minor]
MSRSTLPETLLTAWRDTLDEDALEFFEERAAIIEHEAGLPRADAEARAYALTVAYQQRQSSRNRQDNEESQEARHVPD